MESPEASQSGPIRYLWAPFQRRHKVGAKPLPAVACLLTSPRLLDFKAQERYYTKIIDRYMAFCSDAGKGDELLRRLAHLDLANENSRHDRRPNTSPATLDSNVIPAFDAAGQKDLAALMMAIRKLREAIVASKRVDDFSIQAYIFCIRLSILTKHMESYHPAILYLLQKMHRIQPLSKSELQEFVGYLVLDLACRQNDLAKAYSVRYKYKLHDAKIDQVLKAIAHDDYYLFWKVKHHVDGHKAKLMEWAEDGVKKQTLKSIGRSYLHIDLSALERSTNTSWSRLTRDYSVGWYLDGGKVIIRKPKAR